MFVGDTHINSWGLSVSSVYVSPGKSGAARKTIKAFFYYFHYVASSHPRSSAVYFFAFQLQLLPAHRHYRPPPSSSGFFILRGIGTMIKQHHPQATTRSVNRLGPSFPRPAKREEHSDGMGESRNAIITWFCFCVLKTMEAGQWGTEFHLAALSQAHCWCVCALKLFEFTRFKVMVGFQWWLSEN